ncbi:MAG TPA: adenylate/guanylate cyclase domain-containing protein [Bacilli bacterium]
MKKQSARITVIGNVLVAFLSLIIFLSTTLQVLTFSLYDFDMKSTMSNEPNENVIVIGIDDESLTQYGTFPWDRDIYVPFLDKLTLAKAVAFDITFRTKSKNPENDRLFIEALKKYDNVIIPSYAVMENEFNKITRGKVGEPLMAYGLEKPLPEIYDSTEKAHINRVSDNDGVIRENLMRIATPEDGVFDSMALKAVQMAGYHVDPRFLEDPHKGIKIKYEADGLSFNAIPFNVVMREDFPVEYFQDSIVLIGMIATSDDQGATPIDKSMYLVYAHANITQQLLDGNYITVGTDRTTVLLMILMLVLIGVLTWRLKAITSVILVFVLTGITLYTHYFIFETFLTFIDVIYPLTTLFLSFFANMAIKTYYETKSKNFITKQFGRYISPDLVKAIAKSDQELELGGINKELSILFLDIRGFTTLSEKLKPEEVVDFLNTMFNLITQKSLDNRGTIDKFIGDAAMILYNAPLDVPDHEYYAVKTAWDIQQGMVAVREQILKKYEVSVSVGIGINTGMVVVGNIGSFLRVDYTAIGDNVNIAARIESNTTANQILVSEATYERTKDYFGYNCIGERMMKGKTVAVKLYEVTEVLKKPDELTKAG